MKPYLRSFVPAGRLADFLSIARLATLLSLAAHLALPGEDGRNYGQLPKESES
jgi:hypothetical protein